MAKRSRKAKPKLQVDAVPPTDAQIANGDFERDFVTQTEDNTKAMTYRRKDSFIVEKWCQEGEPLFPEPAKRFIADCVTLWAKVGSRRLTAAYGERLPVSTNDDGYSQQDALDELAGFRRLLGPYERHQWGVFENVLRYNLPAGVAGSDYANNPAQSIQSAKLIVSNVACSLAGKLGY